MHTYTHTRTQTLISVDSYAQHIYKCTVVLILTFTTLQTRSFRVSWNAREASYYSSLKQKCSWHDLMMFILLVLNSFMKNLSTTKFNDLISDFFRGQASRQAYIYLKLAE